MALEGNGTTQYMTASTPVTGAPFTCGCKFYAHDVNSNDAVFSFGDTGSSNNHFRLHIGGGGGARVRWIATAGGTAGFSQTPAIVAVNTWYWVVAVESASNDRRVWFLSTEYTNSTSSTPSGIDTMDVGRLSRDNPSQYFDGMISDVFVEARVWDNSEILAIFSDISPLIISPTVALYKDMIRDHNRPNIGNAMSNNGMTVADHSRVIYPFSPSIISIPTIGGDVYRTRTRRFPPDPAPLVVSSLDSIIVVTSDYTVTVDDDIIICDASSGPLTVTLLAASGQSGRKYVIKKIDSSSNPVTVDANATETVDDGLTAVLTAQYESVTITSDGTEWWIL